MMPLIPLTMTCLMQASTYYHLDYRVMESIRKVEAGQVGKISINRNGTYDVGPFQINSFWIRQIRKDGYPLDPVKLRDNGCVNAWFAGYIMKRLVVKAPGHSVWYAIGAWHSGSPALADDYRKKVFAVMVRLYGNQEKKGVLEAMKTAGGNP